jgi:predicted nucleic acid-binding protein
VEEKLVLDTSVVLKWYLQHETYAEQALLLRQAYLDGRSNMIAPDLLLVEFANILRYQLEMTTDEIKDTVQGLLDMGFEWVKLEKSIIDGAVEIAREFNLTIYDALFVSLAKNCQARFITADEKAARNVQSLDFVFFLGNL